jgi:conjugal transfer mating pair stabilization protein TraG
MMPTVSIYATTADLTTLNAIFNGVAMICGQTAFIWGAAMLASMWMLLSTTVKAPIAAFGGNSAGVIPKGALNAFMPFVLALLLTNPGFQGQVQVNSTVNLATTVIDNVPYVISVIPSVGSTLSQDAGAIVETAFQGTGTDYASISASGNGFINPLKVLLASRSAMSRLNGLQPEIESFSKYCLGQNSAIDYVTLNQMVNNAGNSGATAGTSIPINGANPTALGALLYNGSLTPGFDLDFPGAGNTSCLDAANFIANDITNAFNSVEFSRIIQGATNGMDQPVYGGVDINKINAQWLATRNSNTTNGATATGSGQAQAEVVNLLAGEMVANQLACLSKATSDKAVCEAAMVQANEVERNNIQFAAAEVPMLKYAGSFANYLLALIIGLGPILVIFMMFSGVSAGKCIKTVAHLIAWPLLVTNVGSEIINGMIYIQVANFTAGIAGNGGIISQAENYAIYKELSFQVGSASHMMASLPVIMGMIFALGESSALVNVGANLGPKGNEITDNVSPKANEQKAVFSNSGLGNQSTHIPGNGVNPNYSSVVGLNGATPLSAAAIRSGEEAASFSKNHQYSTSEIKTLQQNENVSNENASYMDNQNYAALGVDATTAKAFAETQGSNKHASDTDASGTAIHSSSSNNTSTSIGAGAKVGTGPGGIGASGDIKTNASANSGLNVDQNASHQQQLTHAKDVSKRMEDLLNFTNKFSNGKTDTTGLSHRLTQQKSYVDSLAHNETASSVIAKSNSELSTIVAHSANIGLPEIAGQVTNNTGIRMFAAYYASPLESNPEMQEKIKSVNKNADAGATTDIKDNPFAQKTARLFRAAQLAQQDTNLSDATRLQAGNFVVGLLNEISPTGVIHTPVGDVKDHVENADGTPAKVSNIAGTPLNAPPAAVPLKTAVSSTVGNNQSKIKNQIDNNGKEKVEHIAGADEKPVDNFSSYLKHAEKVGLGEKQITTTARALLNVADATIDKFRDKGTPNFTSVGTGFIPTPDQDKKDIESGRLAVGKIKRGEENK